MKIGLFFGSFNPIHSGHLIIANQMVENTDMQQVWFVVSPQSPFKNKSSLLNEYDRLHLVELAIEDNPNLRTSSIEFSLPQPSYTIDTLTYLKEKYPQHEFCLIMGGDNLSSFTKWKNYEQILAAHHIYIYQRRGQEATDLSSHEKVHLCEFPLLDISATYLRQAINEGRSVRYLIPDKPLKYIEEMSFYKS